MPTRCGCCIQIAGLSVESGSSHNHHRQRLLTVTNTPEHQRPNAHARCAIGKYNHEYGANVREEEIEDVQATGGAKSRNNAPNFTKNGSSSAELTHHFKRHGLMLRQDPTFKAGTKSTPSRRAVLCVSSEFMRKTANGHAGGPQNQRPCPQR